MELPEAIAKSIKDKGIEETTGVISRALCWIAHENQTDLEFECDLGNVLIERKNIEDKH